MERGLAVPIVGWYYEKFQPDSLEFLETYQDEQISIFARNTYEFASLVRTPIAEMTEYDHYCYTCLQEKITKIESTSGELPPEGKTGLAWASTYLTRVPSYLMMHAADVLAEKVISKDVAGIWQCVTQAGAIADLEFDRAFGNTPLLKLEEYDNLKPAIVSMFPEARPMIRDITNFCASGLHLAYSSDMPLIQYLDIVADYRGTLRDLFSSHSDPTKAIESARDTVTRLNGELDDIRESKRYRWGTYAVNVLKLPSVVRLLMKVSLSGGHGVESVVGDWLNLSAKTRDEQFSRVHNKNPKFQEKLLARYFAKELPVVQLWGLQKQITQLRRKSCINRRKTLRTKI
jgi:hypothetical protein